MDEKDQPEQEFANEYGYIQKDIKRVLINNALIIILLVALYFADKKYGFLSQVTESLSNFLGQ